MFPSSQRDRQKQGLGEESAVAMVEISGVVVAAFAVRLSSWLLLLLLDL